jgi:hypothetical protein
MMMRRSEPEMEFTINAGSFLNATNHAILVTIEVDVGNEFPDRYVERFK